jgi:lipid-binding SYLF domain-containing protein
MENVKRNSLHVGIVLLAILMVGLFFFSHAPAIAGDRERDRVQGLVDSARGTLKEFIGNPNYAWFNENLDHAKGVLIFPRVLKGGFIFGGSGGTGVFLVRDEKTGSWGEPAFYTLGSLTFGFQIGGEATEIVMLAMTQRAIDSLLSSSFKLGGDVSIALGPVGIGAKAIPDIPNVTADFYSFAKSKGLYAGLNLEGSFISVRDSLNRAYYGKDVRPADIIVRKDVRNIKSAEIRETLQCKC